MSSSQIQRRRLPEETVARIYKLVDQGLSYKKIADQLEVHYNSVWKYVKRRREDPTVSLTIRLRSQVEALRRAGKSYEEIARELGWSSNTVFRCAKRWGICKPKAASVSRRCGPRNQTPPETEVAVLGLLRGGLSYRRTALLAGCCEKTVSRIAKRNGCKPRRWCREGLAEQEVATLKKLLATQLSYPKIAEYLDLAETTVARYARENGYTRRRGPLTKDELVRIDQLTAEGKTYGEIAAIMGLSKSAVASNARRRAIERGEAPRVRQLTKAERAELLARVDAGETYKAVARKFGVAARTVYQQHRNRKAEVDRSCGVSRCSSCGAVCHLPCVACGISLQGS